MADVAILQQQVEATPDGYLVPGAQEIVIKSVKASFDGSGAGGPYVPVLQFVAPNGFISVECPLGSTVAAGSSVDVSWFPRGGVSGGGGGGGNLYVNVPLDTPDVNANGFPTLTTRYGFTLIRRVLPSFLNGVDGSWTSSIIVPSDYVSGGTVTLYLVADATTGTVEMEVGSAVTYPGVSADTGYNVESPVTVTVPGTANYLFTVAVPLVSTPPTPGEILNLEVVRKGSVDTCAAVVQLLNCVYSYLA